MKVADRATTFTRFELTEAVAARIGTGATVATIDRVVARVLASDQVIAVHEPDTPAPRGRARYTSRDMLAVEQRLLAAFTATNTNQPLTADIVESAIADRIKAVLRRRAPQMTSEIIEIEGLRVDPVTHRVSGNGEALDLGPTEFRLLHFFMTHAERVHTRAQLLDQVWGDHVFVEERTVDVHIRRLRASLESSGHDRLIQTVRGTGYRFSTIAE